jgi:gamma-glutamyltranspeptidase
VAELETLGYQVNRWATQSLYFGGAHSVAVEDGQTIGAGDLRRSGSVAVG